jgi:DNA-binding beta-propeller fold protein YncE
MLFMQSSSGYKVVNRYPVPGNGGWDYISIDSAARRLYVSHGTEANVVDADNGKLIGTIRHAGHSRNRIASEFKHGFTSNGRENKVSMFDTDTLKLINKIDVGKGPDGIYYDSGDQARASRTITARTTSPPSTPKPGRWLAPSKAEGDGESAVVADGVVYLNLEDTNEVIVFDPKSSKSRSAFPIGVAKGPTGLEYDAKTKRSVYRLQ